MKLPNVRRKISANGSDYLVRRSLSGKFSVPANEPPAGDPAGGQGGAGGGTDPSKGGTEDKTFTQADLNRIATREKAEGKAAAEKAIAESLGVSIEDAKAIIAASKEAEDKKKSEADKDREAAAKERTEAEKVRKDAAKELHEARVRTAFAAAGFTGDDDALKRVLPMVTVAEGASSEDIAADVKELKKTLNPDLFGAKKGGAGGGRLPGGDPKGGTPPPAGGEDAMTRGAQRFKDKLAKRPGYDPTKKTA
jgi:hypothetical protein